MRSTAMAIAALCAAPALAQDMPTPARTIQVMGVGRVSTAPTLAAIDYWMAGEGKTPDEASAALVATQKAIAQGVAGLLGSSAEMTNSNLVVIAVRGQQCPNGNQYNNQPRLSEGACAIVGYLATMQGSIRTSMVAKAGTAVGLISRLGARDARIGSFALTDGVTARRAALAEAIADAKRQATALAAASGEKLGAVQTIRDQNFGINAMIEITPSAPPPPPPPAAPRAVEIDVNPRLIETGAQVFVSFAIAP